MTGRPEIGATSATAYKSGPRQGGTGVPSMAELRNPTLRNSKISIDTNVTTSVPILIRPWLDGYEKNFAQGSILFVYKDTKSRNMHTVSDLPTMNFLLEEAHNDLKSQQYNAGMYNDIKSNSGLQNFEDNGFTLFGILRNDMYADSQLQKLLNVDVFGRAMVANIWGPLHRGDHVGVALRKINTGAKFGGFIQANGAILPSQVIKAPTGGIYQFVPTLNKNLVDESDETKLRDYELHVPLGVVVHQVARVPSLGARKLALRSQDHYTLLPRIEILMI